MNDLAESARLSVAVSEHCMFNNEIVSDEVRAVILAKDPCIVCGLPHTKCPAWNNAKPS